MSKSDDRLTQSYPLLVSLHKSCFEVVENVRMEGRIRRHMREINDQVENEKWKKHDEKIETIQADLSKLRSENEELRNKIKLKT